MTRMEIPAADDIALRAAEAMGGMDDPGEFSARRALAAVGALLSGARVRRETARLGLELLRILLGQSSTTIHPKDPRFRDPAWTEHPLFRRLGQAYFAFCRAVENSVDELPDWRDRERAQLLVSLVTSTLSPTNLLFTNPAALKVARETRGKSLLRGARNFLHDLRHNGGMPSQVDRSKYKVGENLALTEGAVVFRNEVLEILQYRPQTPTVHARPILLMTPQINKFYFLDLAPGRSFVEFAVRQGLQVFVVSWRNPTRNQSGWTFDTYCQALLDATDAVRSIAGSGDLNTLGFCAGGITMSALLSHLVATGDARVHCASYAVTLLDFSVPALIGSLQSKPLLKTARSNSRKRGVLSGRDLGRLFAWFRPNDLVWNYWVNNYLLGKPPPAFDILAWNADSTNLPAGLHQDFLDIFQSNAFTEAGRLKVLGTPVNLRSIKIDTFVTGAVTDHLTPWKGCYRTTQLLGGKSTFVLSNAGHVASLVNPPGNSKSSYWLGPQPGPDAEAWLAQAREHKGTWWEYWAAWIGPRSGEQRPAPARLGSKKHPPLGPAPGVYVFG